MNIGIFTDCYRPTKNGVVTSIIYLKEGLEQRGHQVSIFTVTAHHDDVSDPTVHCVPSLPFNSGIEIRLGLVNQHNIKAIIQAKHLDILHSHTEFSLGLAARRAARALHLPCVHTLHTMYEAYRHYLRLGRFIPISMIRRWLRWYLAGYHAVICPSRKMHTYVTSFMPHCHAVVIGNGVSASRFNPGLFSSADRDRTRAALGIRPTEKVMLYVGRIAQEKRISELLSGLRPLLQKHSGYKAVFVGGGPSYEYVRNLVQQERLEKQVILTGYIEWERIPTFYAMADVFLTASVSENNPMTLIEALMSGLPIVARQDDSYADLIVNGRNGFLVDSDQQLAERAAELLDHDGQREAFSQQSVTLSSRFTTEIHAAQIESLYQGLKNVHT